MNTSHKAGFTLIELLVGMALLGIILAALTNFFSQTSQVATQSSTRAELQQEVLNAQQLIAGKLREAWYVYPPSSTMMLSNTSLTKNPVTLGQNWTTGTHPILAMILPPETSGGLYRFIAYYPVLRSDWVTGTASTSWRNPGPDDTNANTWVLAEYRVSMPAGFSAASFPPSPAPAVQTGGVANLLSDYIAPTNAAGNTYTMFAYTLDATSTSVTDVKINLATTRQIGGKTLRLPNATDEYELAVYPSNLGKIAAP